MMACSLPLHADSLTVEGDLNVEGNLGVGTPTPSEKLEVNGNLKVGAITTEGIETRFLIARGGASPVGGRKIVLAGNVYTVALPFDTRANRGLALMVVNRVSLAVESYINYDCYNLESERVGMADALNALGADKIVIITSEDAWRANAALKSALLRVGASPEATHATSRGAYSSHVGARQSYALIGIPGIGAGNGLEAYNETPEGAVLATISTHLVRSIVDTTGYFDLSNRKDDTFIKNDGSVEFTTTVRLPQSGDLSMGSFRAGTNPAE
jgi:hypothetical protein